MTSRSTRSSTKVSFSERHVYSEALPKRAFDADNEYEPLVADRSEARVKWRRIGADAEITVRASEANLRCYS
jgi:hypothetical protein